MTSRRSTDSNASQPAMKVVGFRVEGVPPSPAQAGLLQETLLMGGGSPDPVIIPPSFQSDKAGRVPIESPGRLHTIPSFISHDSKSTSMEDILVSTANVRGPESSRPSQPKALMPTGSLPPMSDAVASDYRRYAASMARISPSLTPGYQRSAKSQPGSATITPPVSPYGDADPRVSVSFRQQSAFEQVQSGRPEHAPMAATFADRTSLRGVKPDASWLASPSHSEALRVDVGTPRQQHGFKVASRGPEAAPTSAPSTSAATPASEAPSTPSTSGKTKLSTLPAVPEVLTSSAQPRAAAGEEAIGESSREGKPRSDPAGSKQQASGDKAESAREGGEKKKATTKAERRALQEKQRAEKAAAKAKEAELKQKPAPGAASTAATPREAAPSPARPAAQQAAAASKGAKPPRRAGGQTSQIFAHLPQYKALTIDTVFSESAVAAKVHPEILKLGLQYADGSITGGNARCLAMLLAFKSVIKDYQTPESKELSRDLTSQLNLCIQFLVECRPLSVSMGTAIKSLKLKVSHISAATPQEEAKLALLDELDTFIQEKLTYADEQVARTAQTKVASGDVVLTFAFSSAVLNTFLAAKREGKTFRVVVVDSRPHYEGRAMLSKLLSCGIPCTYLHLHALCFTMQEVTKVFMGASGAMSNGTILARAGSAAVALAAHAMQRPVIVCCETLKFVDRVQLDSITYNELGDPGLLASVAERPDLAELHGWQEQPQLDVLNLMYDAMPCEFVTMIVTEVGAIPATSIPVVLREYRTAPKL